MQLSNPADRKKVKDAINEISNSLTRIEAERDLIKEIVKEVSDTHQIPRKIVRKMAKTYHSQNLTQEVQEHEEFVDLYESVTQTSQEVSKAA